MKKLSFALMFSLSCSFCAAQFVARAEIKEPVDGLCDIKNVYALLPMLGEGQVEAECAVNDQEIEEKLNREVAFLKENPDYEDKGMVSIIISCKGEAVRYETDNKTKSPVLDQQILEVFRTLKEWKAGKLDKKKVDSIRLWSFEIAKGKISLK